MHCFSFGWCCSWSYGFKRGYLISNNYNVITDDNFIATLSDSNGNKLINKTITFTVTDLNNKSKVYNVTTDANGIATLDVKLCAGNYSIMGNFTGR